MLPGVGAFADGMAALCESGLAAPLVEKARAGTPLLGICLGMQMLFEESSEGGAHAGLGLVPGRVQRLPAQALDGAPQPVPNIGWCALQPAGGRKDFSGTPLAGIGPGAQCYFVHSYEAKPAQAACRLADISYGGRPVCAAVQSGRVLGCQFHPEKSAGSGWPFCRVFCAWRSRPAGQRGKRTACANLQYRVNLQCRKEVLNMSRVPELFGSMVFSESVMRDRLPKNVYRALCATIREGRALDPAVADVVAAAMKDWAVSKGATHFTHWFQP